MEKRIPVRCQMPLNQCMRVGRCKLSRACTGVELSEHLILMDALNRTAYRVRQARQPCLEGSLQRVVPGGPPNVVLFNVSIGSSMLC